MKQFSAQTAMSQEANRRDHELNILTRDGRQGGRSIFADYNDLVVLCNTILHLLYKCSQENILKRRPVLSTSYWKTLSRLPDLKLDYLVMFYIVLHLLVYRYIIGFLALKCLKWIFQYWLQHSMGLEFGWFGNFKM